MLKYPHNEHSPQHPERAALSRQKQRDNLAQNPDKWGISTQYEAPVVLLKKWVDFHYVVDGKTYEFSIPGGGYVTLQQLVEVLGIANGNANSENTSDDKKENVPGEDAQAEKKLTLSDVQISEKDREFVANVESVGFSNLELAWVGKVEEENTVGEIKNFNQLEVQYSADLTEEQIAEINAQTVEAGDWVLVSVKSFTSEETLTVTMKSGDQFVIRVTDAMDSTSPYEKGTVFTGYNTREDGFIINLFDYGPEGTLDGGSTTLENPDNLNSGINAGHSLKFTAYGKKPSEVQTNWQNVLTQNHFSGTDAATQGIVKNTLSGGYPQLSDGSETLGYLFNTTPDGSNKAVYKNVTGLFQKDVNGKYFYDSNENYAYYNPSQGDEGSFELSDTFPEEGSDWGVGFFPFNTWNGGKTCIHWNGWCPGTSSGNNGRYYYNHHFGMTLDGVFQLSPTGKVNGEDMVFNFSGDDDLWVFIDDVLVLDIGGIHNPVGGSINFNTGTVTVNSAYPVNSVIDDSVSGPAVSTTIQQCFINAGKTWNPEAYSEHTIKVFYVERGGCYSNCQMEFNLTLFKDVEFDKKDNIGNSVPGAEFRLFKEDNTTPLMETYYDYQDNTYKEREYVRISDENGHVKFDHVPVGTYCLRETAVPNGYLSDDTTYTVKVAVRRFEDQEGYEVVSSILNNKNQNVSEILNTKIEYIDIGVEKEWPGGLPSGATATFALRRCRSYEGDIVVHSTATASTLNVYRVNRSWGSAQLLKTGEFESNKSATVSWTFPYHYGGTKNQYRIDNSTQTQYSDQQSISVTMPSTGSINVYIRDDNRDGYYDSNGLTSNDITISGTTVQGDTIQHVSATNEDDTDFNPTSPTIELSSSNNWAGVFEHQPTVGKRNGLIETYTYYIEETSPTSEQGYQPVYIDSNGNVFSNLPSPGVGTSGTYTVINIKHTDIPVQKTWQWSTSDQQKQIDSWSAAFNLQYREVYESGEPDAAQNVQSLWGYVLENGSPKQITITNTTGGEPVTGTFEDLPMYKVHENGSIYRLIYAVDEAEYTIHYRDGSTSTWSRNSTSFDEHYAPSYDEDAGQEGDTIIVTNAPSKEREQKTISLGIQKSWEGPDGTTDPPDNAVSATFKLKRYYHEEYLEIPDSSSINLVTVTLDLGNGRTTELEVPSGYPVYFTADLKTNGNPGINLAFSRTSPSSSGSCNLTYPNPGHYASTDSEISFVVSNPVTPATNETWTFVPELSSYAETINNYVLGGIDGIRLATFDYDENNQEFPYDVTGEIPDTGFEEEFDLDPGNDWAKSWEKLPQIVEVKSTKTIDGVEHTYLKTIVYSYYYEEVKCNPPEYYAVFRDHNNAEVRYGDELSRVEVSGLTIDAINKHAPDTTLYKVDESDLSQNSIEDYLLQGAQFTVVKYTSDAFREKDNSWGDRGEKNAVLKENDMDGKFGVEGLGPGFYEIEETERPDGYIQTSENPRFKVVLNAQTEKLEIESLSPSDVPFRIINGYNGTDDNVIIYGNIPGAALPNTGGPGTNLIYLLGTMLTALAGAGLMMRRRRNAA